MWVSGHDPNPNAVQPFPPAFVQSPMRKKVLKILYYALPAAVLCWFLAGYLSARYVTSPNPQEIEHEKELGGLIAADVNFYSEDSTLLKGWYFDQRANWSVILLPGIYGNRTSMETRAHLYLEQGYNVLMPDLRGTGESEGDIITFGWHESRDLMAAYYFLQEQGQDSIGVHGISLGAATVAYSLRFHPEYKFLVLESPYDNINHAWEHRMEKFPVPKFALAPMQWFTERRTGVIADSLFPENYIRMAQVPTLHMAGDCEQQIPLAETEKIFDNCGATDKQLHIFKGAKHQDFLRRTPVEYAQVLSPFICRFQCNNPNRYPPSSISSLDTQQTIGSSMD